MEKMYETHVHPRLLEIGAWARDGFTDKAISKKLKISYTSFKNYKKEHFELAIVLEETKSKTDIKVENALLKKAIGYCYDEVTQERVLNTRTNEYEMVETKRVKKEVQPDLGSQTLWLINRKSKIWKDRKNVEVSVDSKENLTMEEIDKRLAEFDKKHV